MSDKFAASKSKSRLNSPSRQFHLPALVFILMLSTPCQAGTVANESSTDLPVWLVRNNWRHCKGLPKYFRKIDASTEDLGSKIMRKGLDTLKASGSGQFSRENLAAIKNAIGARKIIVLDLRQESHGFINREMPISWYQGQDQINWGKSLSEIELDESRRLDELQKEKTILVYDLIKPANDANAPKTGIDPEKIELSSASNEASICKMEQTSYVRIPVADYHHPSDDCVDKFTHLVLSLGQNDWLHIHSGADDGRATTFLAMYDMMHNADKVSFDQIIERQQILGGIDLLQTSAKQDKTVQYIEARAKFIQDFYNYCSEQISHKFSCTYTEWKKMNASPDKK
jgi:hypothetical protein